MAFSLTDSWLMDTVILLATLLGLVYYWSISTFSYWQKLGVKCIPNPKPLVGSMAPAISLKRQLGLHFQDLYYMLDGERFGGYYKFRRPAILLRDPALIRHVVLKDFSNFTDNDIASSEKHDPMLAYNLFSMKGDAWKYARSKFSPLFSTGKIRNMFTLIKETCNDLKSNIQNRIDSGNLEFDAKLLAANYTTDNVGSCAFGIRCNSLQNEDNEFRRMGRSIMDPTPWRGFLMMVTFFWPSMGKVFGFLGLKFISDNVSDFFRRLVSDAMAYREKNNVKRNDLIQLLMQLKKKGELDEDPEDKTAKNGHALDDNKVTQKFDKKLFEFTDDVLTAQAVGFFFDGYETSSIALSMTMHELAVNPGVQAKLRAELQKSMQEYGGELTYDGVRECAYLDHVFMETLRKYPAVGVLTKTCTQRYTIPDTNVHLEVGTPVSFPVWAMHYDPKFFPDPETFDPERFSDENKRKIIPCSFLPFGEGPRQCIGMRFAMAQVKAALATIVTNFELQRSPKTQHPITLDPNFFMVAAVGGLYLQAVPLKG